MPPSRYLKKKLYMFKIRNDTKMFRGRVFVIGWQSDVLIKDIATKLFCKKREKKIILSAILILAWNLKQYV